MIGISAIGRFVPETVVDNLEQGRRFNEPEDFMRKKIGALTLPRMSADKETSDLAVAALDDLLANSELQKSQIEALIVVTQNPDGFGLPHTAAIVQHKAGLPKAIAAFDVSLGCSGYVYGLSILKGLMESCGMKNAVLITADPYSKVVDPDNRVTTLLFGDAATATWLSHDACWDIDTPAFGTDGAGADHLIVRDNGKLFMNGRQVFTFAAAAVPKHIHAYLDDRGLSTTDIDSYCLHQGSGAILTALEKRFPEVADRFVNELSATGNTISSSIPLILMPRLADATLNKILICGFGVGLSWATSLLTRRTEG